jgi:hypothetical protein
MNHETERSPQSEYNGLHNSRSHHRPETADQMLIEQVVTGDRGYTHVVFGQAAESRPEDLENALEGMHWRDLLGYAPQKLNRDVPPETYALGGDRVSAPGYAHLQLQPGTR